MFNTSSVKNCASIFYAIFVKEKESFDVQIETGVDAGPEPDPWASSHLLVFLFATKARSDQDHYYQRVHQAKDQNAITQKTFG